MTPESLLLRQVNPRWDSRREDHLAGVQTDIEG